MHPIPTEGTDLRFLVTLPGVVQRPRADTRPGQPRADEATPKAVKFQDWALL